MLASAVALLEGFTYAPNDKLFWKQAYGSENTYLFVSPTHIDSIVLQTIKETMNKNEHLVIACKSYDEQTQKMYANIKVKKIPQILLNRCEFDKNDYALNIINPPKIDDLEDEDE